MGVSLVRVRQLEILVFKRIVQFTFLPQGYAYAYAYERDSNGLFKYSNIQSNENNDFLHLSFDLVMTSRTCVPELLFEYAHNTCTPMGYVKRFIQSDSER